MNKLLSLTKPLTVKDNPKHDGRANECRDWIDGQIAFEWGQACDEVAEQSQIHADEGRGGDEQFMIAAAEQESGDVRHSQTQEGDGTAERRDECREEAWGQDDEHTASLDVYSEILGITFA